jgi:hypothetical protein
MAALTPRPSETTYDPGIRRRSLRRGRERGCSVYIPASVLHDAGFSADDPPPFYRLVGHARSRNAGSVIVSLYREP